MEEPGALGLQLVERTSDIQFTQSFLIQLKNNNKINNYKWFIYYGEKTEKDYLVFGCLPHEFIIPDTGNHIFQNLDLDKDFFNINDEVYYNKIQMEIIFDEIYITSNLTNLKKDEGFNEIHRNGYLKFKLGVILW